MFLMVLYFILLLLVSKRREFANVLLLLPLDTEEYTVIHSVWESELLVCTFECFSGWKLN